MKTSSMSARRSGRRRGLTLVELIAVLAIIAILATIVMENVMEKMKAAQRDAEAQNMTAIGDALLRSVIRQQYVPAVTNWAATVAGEMGNSVSSIASNRLMNTRFLVLDPTFRVGTNTTGTGLPYTQGSQGSLLPTSPRLVIISSTGKPLPVSLPSFSNLWVTANDEIPAGMTTWKGEGRDIHLTRVDLQTVFRRLILNNLDSRTAAPYSVESTNALTTIPSFQSREIWVLHNTGLNLHFAGNTVQSREFVFEDSSYVFENGRWSRYAYAGRNGAGGPFGDMVDLFLRTAEPSSPKFYADKQSIVDTMFDYLFYIGLWAGEGFPPESNAARPQIPEVQDALNSQVQLEDTTYNLIN